MIVYSIQKVYNQRSKLSSPLALFFSTTLLPCVGNAKGAERIYFEQVTVGIKYFLQFGLTVGDTKLVVAEGIACRSAKCTHFVSYEATRDRKYQIDFGKS